MPVTNEWLIEGRVLLTRVSGSVTMEELIVASANGTAMIETGAAPVYNLVDISAMKGFPTRVTEVRQISVGGTSPKLEWIIVYGIQNSMVNFLATLFTQFLKTNSKVVPTQDDALALIARVAGGELPAPVRVS